MRFRSVVFAGFGLWAGWSAPSGAVAQEPAPQRRLAFTGDLGFVKTGGNTDFTTLSIGAKTTVQVSTPVVLQHTFAWVLGRTDGVESANQLQTGIRVTASIADGLRVFLGGDYSRDRFAGVAKRFSQSVGVGYQVVETARHRLLLEAGLTYFQETPTSGQTANFTAGRAGGTYRYTIRDKAYFEQAAEYLPNFDNSGDYRLASESVLVAPLSRLLALKVGYLARYRGDPPPGFDTTDTTFRTSLQVTF